METPLVCGNGTYANSTGLSSCKTCPAGYSCGDPRLTPKLCPDGFYSGDGFVYCLECPAGYRYDKDFVIFVVKFIQFGVEVFQ